MTRSLAIAGAAAGAAVLLLPGCQTTQETSALREKEGSKLVSSDKGLEITKVSQDVKVLDTALIHDVNGTAVVVTLKNNSKQGLRDVPISVNVVDKKGKSVFKNDTPGLEDSLTSIGSIEPGQTVDWVNDQVLATGDPADVRVQVGATDGTFTGAPPQIDISKPKYVSDKISGDNVQGTMDNKSDFDQKYFTLYAVARRGGKVVAAGRGAIKRLVTDRPKPAQYSIYFIGDPKGADITVAAPATTFNNG